MGGYEERLDSGSCTDTLNLYIVICCCFLYINIFSPACVCIIVLFLLDLWGGNQIQSWMPCN